MRRAAAKGPISCNDLAHSLIACYRVEDAIWRLLQAASLSERSSAVTIQLALDEIRPACPDWCTPAAWECIADMFARWSETFNSLELFWKLRRKRTIDVKESDDNGTRESPLQDDGEARKRAA